MRRPLLHFALIGAMLFAAGRARDPAPETERIALDVATRERLARELGEQSGRPPTPGELAASAAAWLDEEILVREARRLGYDRADPVVRTRLVRNMRFLEDSDAARSDEQLYRDALELGMDRTDIAVRRRLVQQLRFALTAAAPAGEPSDAELHAQMAAHPERYRIPARIRLAHVYLSRDRRGPTLTGDARALLERLRREGIPPAAAARFSDPFDYRPELPLLGEADLARRLGGRFARDVMGLPTGSWQGPIGSAYGEHLVWVRERQPAREPDFEAVRPALVRAARAERDAQAVEAGMESLRARYAIDLAPLERP